MGWTSQGAIRVVVSGDKSLGSSVDTSIPDLLAMGCTAGQVSPPSIMMNLTSSSKMSCEAPARAFSGAYSLS